MPVNENGEWEPTPDTTHETYRHFLRFAYYWKQDEIDSWSKEQIMAEWPMLFGSRNMMKMVNAGLRHCFPSQSDGIAGHIRHYAISLNPISGTTLSDLENRIMKIYHSKLFEPISFLYCIEHITSNIHCHIYLKTRKYIRKQYVDRINNNERCYVEQLKGDKIFATIQYVKKKEDDKHCVVDLPAVSCSEPPATGPPAARNNEP